MRNYNEREQKKKERERERGKEKNATFLDSETNVETRRTDARADESTHLPLRWNIWWLHCSTESFDVNFLYRLAGSVYIGQFN